MIDNIPKWYRLELFNDDDDDNDELELPVLNQLLFPDEGDAEFDDEIIHDDRFVEEDDEVIHIHTFMFNGEDNIPIEEDSMIEDERSEIIACDVHPHLSLAITSGIEGGALLWLTKEMARLEYISVKQKLTNLKFSQDGSYLGTGSCIGEVAVYSVLPPLPEGRYIFHPVFLLNVWQFSMRSLNWLRWHPTANILFAGGHTGEVLIYGIKIKQEYDFVKLLPGEGESCENSVVSHDGEKLFLLYISKIKSFDIEKFNTLWIVNTYILHKEIVCNIECSMDLSGETHVWIE
ncbi:uncharacterized protein LOC119671106 [Teleopsis dalmanni]|uniref:uncharacterized protein LOC119671106 n=1 Tax=Teleopsis dalmanni TaxID=139649 RepID=UPI000D32C944|nr:uncharacterized protein LOC119671106 [Teleopsis dalmanni]